MIVVNVSTTGIIVDGHAGYDSSGKDIIVERPSKSGALFNKTIVISQKALRNRNITMYNLSDGYFASKEPKDIVIHEYGHMRGKKYGNNGIEIARQALYNINRVDVTTIDTLNYLSEHVSLYSVEPVEKKHRNFYQEIVAEVFVKHINEPNAFTNEFFNVLLGANK